jgi:hypothetical protein
VHPVADGHYALAAGLPKTRHHPPYATGLLPTKTRSAVEIYKLFRPGREGASHLPIVLILKT